LKVAALAAVTFREVLRRKVQVNLLLFGGALIVASYFLSLLTLGEMHRMIADLGLSAMRFIATLLAVFLGASAIAGDVERRVVYSIVAKPVARAEYIVGRFAGVGIALVANVVVMAVVLALVLAFEAHTFAVVDVAYVAAVALTCVHVLVVAAVAVLFSSMTNATLAAIFSLAVAIAGQLTNEMLTLWRGESLWLPRLIWYLVPNLGALNANEAVIYRTPPAHSAWVAAAYGLLYAATALALASAVFERRDLR
jgi:ABC-type transport system involved in multi-copper enzyme maturation permease subunit